MRVRCGWVLLAAMALPLLASAEDQPNTQVPDVRLLAKSDALVSFCTKVDPPAAAKYQEQIKQMVQNTSKAAVTQVRNSDEYQKAHKSITEFLDKVDERNAKRTCKTYLPKSK
jgi:hypothetical protein